MLNDVKIIDSSWHMPLTKRNGFEEFKKLHIKNAIFFDIDKNSKIDTDLPHMLTDKTSWEKIVSNMGIKNHDKIIKSKLSIFNNEKIEKFSFKKKAESENALKVIKSKSYKILLFL